MLFLNYVKKIWRIIVSRKLPNVFSSQQNFVYAYNLLIWWQLCTTTPVIIHICVGQAQIFSWFVSIIYVLLFCFFSPHAYHCNEWIRTCCTCIFHCLLELNFTWLYVHCVFTCYVYVHNAVYIELFTSVRVCHVGLASLIVCRTL